MGMAWSWNTVWRCCRRLPGLAAFVAAVGLASLLQAGPDEEEQFVVIKAINFIAGLLVGAVVMGLGR